MGASTVRRPFRFGVQIYRAESAQDWTGRVRKAEALGYDVLLFPDHFGATFAYGPALAMAAAATSTLRLGSFVLQNPLHHPAYTAMETATLDLLSNGRYELGLGAGGSAMRDYEQTGIPFDPPGQRASALGESVRVLKELLTGKPVTFEGSHYHFHEFQSFPEPVQEHVPLLIGAGGRRLLRLAAQEADIVSVMPKLRAEGTQFHMDETSAVEFARKIELLREAAGERFDRLEINMLIQRLIVTDQQRAAVEELSGPWGLPPDELLKCPYVLIGSVEQIVEQIERQREQFGLSYYVVFDRYLDEFAPVVKRLKGE